jgi:hypothetical protein
MLTLSSTVAFFFFGWSAPFFGGILAVALSQGTIKRPFSTHKKKKKKKKKKGAIGEQRRVFVLAAFVAVPRILCSPVRSWGLSHSTWVNLLAEKVCNL